MTLTKPLARIDCPFFLTLAVFALVPLFAGPLAAAEDPRRLDFGPIDKAVAGLGRFRSVDELASALKKIAVTEAEKARAVYTWVSLNIAYDADSFFRGTPTSTDAGGVFRTGKSVCQGYSELSASLAEKLGLEVAVISGYAKAYSYSPDRRFRQSDHAWNAVKIDGSWRLMDTTWGAGYVDGTKFVKKFTDSWFATDPRVFAYNHFPEDTAWLLTGQYPAPSLGDYEKAAFVPTYDVEKLVMAGFSDEETLALLAEAPLPQFFGQYALSLKEHGFSGSDISALLKNKALPKAFSYPKASIKILRAPTEALQAGKTYFFEFEVAGSDSAYFIVDGAFVAPKKSGTVFSGEVAAKKGELKLSVKTDFEGKNSYWPFVIYQVK